PGRSFRGSTNQKSWTVGGRNSLLGGHEVARFHGTSQVLRVRVSSDSHNATYRLVTVAHRCDAHPDRVSPLEEPFGERLVDHTNLGPVPSIALQDFAPQQDRSA